MSPAGEKETALRSRMAELAAKFIERTGKDAEAMRAGLERVKSGEATALTDILNLAHRAAGTGATLGLQALSERAHRIELLVAELPPGAVPGEPVLAEIGSAIEALAGENERQARGG